MTLEVGRQRPQPGGPGAGLGSSPALRLVEPGPAWDAWLEAAQHDVYHLSGYHEVARDRGEGEPYLAVVGDEERGLAWPYLLRSVAGGGESPASGRTDVTSVYGYPGPVAWGLEPGDGFVAGAFRRVLDTWREQGVVSAFTRFHPLLENAALLDDTASFPEAEGDGHGVVATGSTVSVDLTQPDHVVRGAYGRGLRREIDASRRAGLATVVDDTWDHLAAFALLYRETMCRAGADGYYLFSEDDFRGQRDALGGHLHLLVTLMGAVVAAAGLFTELGGLVEWHLAGSSAAFSALSPAKVLIDDAIRWARARGDRVMHIGGGRGSREDSLLWFKSRFSPRRHPFHTGRWILDRDVYAALVGARPAPPAGRGRTDLGFFPAYRAPLTGVDGPHRVGNRPRPWPATPAWR